MARPIGLRDPGNRGTRGVIQLSAFTVSILVTPLAMRLAPRLGMLDAPGPLKLQTYPVPRVGGLGLFAGLGVVVLATKPALLVPLALAFAVGLVDDIRFVPPQQRLVACGVVGLAAAGVALPHALPTAVAVAAVVILFLLVPNGVNMIDGLDCLAGGAGVTAATGLGVLLAGHDRIIAFGLAAALLAFLVYNRPPARAYLGSAGAYLLGATLSVLLLRAWDGGYTRAQSIGALLMIAYPIGELAVSVIRRARAGASVIAGDRGHIYDQLRGHGWSRAAAVGGCTGTQAVLAGIGIAIGQLSTLAAAAAALGCVAVLFVAAAAGGFLSWPVAAPRAQ